MRRPGPQERDTCRDFVVPALEAAGWQSEQVAEQFPVAAQRVAALGGVTRELGSGFVDYVLEAAPGHPERRSTRRPHHRPAASVPAGASLPNRRPGETVLVRVDGAGYSHDLLTWLTNQRVHVICRKERPPEINRGNLAKIFGELYFLLECRDQNVDLLYATDDDIDFTLPRNVFVIGTMNTADRSTALVDAATRRRRRTSDSECRAWGVLSGA